MKVCTINSYVNVRSAKRSYFYRIDGKTGTGTIQVVIQPGNKNYPRILKTDYIMCRDRKPICLTAQDGDASPYSAPFVYRITDRNLASSWKITRHNGTLTSPSSLGCWLPEEALPPLPWADYKDKLDECMLGIGVVSGADKLVLTISSGSSVSFATQEIKSMPGIKGNN